uniref:DOMON domain-containing protein n=1 Tax=Globodera rostochiensis TaxID=31243 RepID=A0A914HQD3_GLORO
MPPTSPSPLPSLPPSQPPNSLPSSLRIVQFTCAPNFPTLREVSLRRLTVVSGEKTANTLSSIRSHRQGLRRLLLLRLLSPFTFHSLKMSLARRPSSTSCPSTSPSSPSFVLLLFSLYFSLFLFSPICAQDNVGTDDDLPHQLWLINPSARQLERSTPPSQRLPETMCPTPKSPNDTTTTVPSGTPFPVQWQDPDAIPVEAAKFELFSADSGHLLAKLDTLNGETDIGNKTALVNVRIPDGLRCDTCVLRLSVELDERIQLLSCADVRVTPAAANGAADSVKECVTDGECGGASRGRCEAGMCFCRSGFHGTKCGKESAGFASFVLPKSVSAQSVRFPITGSELLWKSNAQANILEFGLKLSIDERVGQRWFILGVQSTEEDSMCQVAMAQWKQKSIPLDVDKVQLIEQKKSEGTKSFLDASKSSGTGVLNIRRLANGSAESETSNNGTTTKKCGLNEHFDVCPEAGRECEPSCDWTAFPDTIPSCAPRGEQCGQPRCVCDEGFVRLSNHHNECKPFSFCQAPEVDSAVPIPLPAGRATSIVPSVTSGSCAINETWEKCGSACEPSCATMYSEEPCGEACETPGCTCDDNFVRSSANGGACILWTDCPSLKEMVTATRVSFTTPSASNASSTPAPTPRSSPAFPSPFSPSSSPNISSTSSDDETTELELFAGTTAEPSTETEVGQCGVNETVNECGRVCETDCVSIFEREECHGCAAPACSCKQGFARSNEKCVYWGDCPTVNSAVAVAASSDQSKGFNSVESAVFPPGVKPSLTSTTGAANGGQSLETPAEEPPMDLCGGEWAWPVGCVGEKCVYRLAWNNDEQTNSVVFTLDTRPTAAKKVPKGAPIWSGVGFSPSGTLLDADMAILEVSGDGAKVRAMDMHVNEELEQLRPDHQQDIRGGGQFSNGLLKAKFWRKLSTEDAAGEDLEFGDENNCFRFLFPVAGGRFEKSGNVTVPVADSLYASDAEVCVRKCGLKGQQQKEDAAQTSLATPNKNQDDASANSCEREFQWPEGCEGSQCEYRAQWAWHRESDDVQFNISARGIGRWTGIGFSRDGRMSGSDIVTGWVYNQKALLIDRFAHNQQLPAIDPADRQDIFDIGGSVEDDVQTISFRRKVVTADRSTDLSLAECLYFLFPVAGGRVLARSSRDFQNARTPIGFHDRQQPERSVKRICQCERDAGGENKTVGRAKRASEDDKAAPAGGPYQCADVAIFQIVDGGEAVRVVDAFALSNDSLFRDERWGGRQSFLDVSVEKGNEPGKLNIWLRKGMKDGDGDNATADLTVHKGVTPVFLASGLGPEPGMNTAERLEFAMVDLMDGASPEPAPSVNSSSSSSSFSTPLSSTSTASPSTSKSQTETVVSATKVAATETTTITSTTTATTTAEPAEEEESTTVEEAGDEDIVGERIVPPAVVVQGGGDDEEPTINEIPELVGRPTTMTKTSSTISPSSAASTSSLTSTRAPMLPPAMLMDENCFGGFAHPENCLGTGHCSYIVEWQAIPLEQTVQFRLSAKMKPGSWTGIGFSSDGAMANADAILVLLLADGRITISDQFSPGYGRPAIDRLQNAKIIGQYGATDGIVAINFSRPLYTGDTEQDADLRQCQNFLFLHSGGPLVHGSADIRKHTETPIRSRNRICLAKCRQQTPVEGVSAPPAEQLPTAGPTRTSISPALETTTDTKTAETVTKTTVTITTPASARPPPTTAIPAPPPAPSPPNNAKTEEGEEIRIAAGGNIVADDGEMTTGKGATEALFNVAIRLTNERWDERLEDAESAQFRELSQRLANSIRSLVAVKWPSLREIKVQKFAEGSVLALLQIRFDGHDAPREAELKDFLQEAAAHGMAEELIWDRDMLDVRREGQEDEEDKWGMLREMQGWALVSLALLLLLCTMSALIFCAFRSRRRRRSAAHRTYPTKQSPYSAGYHHHAPQYAALGGNGCDKASDTTVKTNATGRGGAGTAENGTNAKTNGQNGARIETPKGIGEATYREWFTKVASKNSPSHYQESSLNLATPPTPTARHSMPQSPLQSYVSYPNDPSFYTLNGEHRIVPPPPAYYHQRPY